MPPILEVGLGCAWLEQGDKLLDAAFNGVRDVILGTSRRAGYLFIGNEVHEGNRALYVQFDALADRDGNVSLRALANFYGVVMLTDSHAPAPPDALADLGTTALFGQRTT